VFFLRYLAFQKVGAVLLEHALLITCVLMSPLQVGSGTHSPESYVSSLCKAFTVAITFQLFLHLRDAYEFGAKPLAPKFLLGFGQALLLASAILFVIHLLIPGLMLGQRDLALTIASVSVVLTMWHLLVRLYFRVRRRCSKLLIMGTGPLARALATEIVRHREYGLSVCGFVDDDPALVGVSIVNPKVLGLNHELERLVSQNGIDRVVVEVRDRRGRLPVDELLHLKMRGVAVEEATSVYERITGKIAIANLKPSWMLFGEGFEVSRRILRQKQIVSFSISLLLLILALPLFPFIALFIKLDSRGPLFFRQERVGQNGKIFTLWKFRSMCKDAERDTGPVWAKPEDNRVTRVGRYLRRTRLDELPQLINVLKGDMSLVGPRPERFHFVEELSQKIPFYYLRHSVKPGITGWAQINYRYGSTVEDAIEKLQYDLFYIKNISWALDLSIIVNTIKTVLVRKGS
jgi:sugar transferase (PEP-CTERM system associated)